MNLDVQLRAPRDTCHIPRSRRLIPLRERASRESLLPSAPHCEPLRSQIHAAKIADRSAAPHVCPPACARWSGNVRRQLSQLADYGLAPNARMDTVVLSEALQRNAKHEARLSNISSICLRGLSNSICASLRMTVVKSLLHINSHRHRPAD